MSGAREDIPPSARGYSEHAKRMDHIKMTYAALTKTSHVTLEQEYKMELQQWVEDQNKKFDEALAKDLREDKIQFFCIIGWGLFVILTLVLASIKLG